MPNSPDARAFLDGQPQRLLDGRAAVLAEFEADAEDRLKRDDPDGHCIDPKMASL